MNILDSAPRTDGYAHYGIYYIKKFYNLLHSLGDSALHSESPIDDSGFGALHSHYVIARMLSVRVHITGIFPWPRGLKEKRTRPY